MTPEIVQPDLPRRHAPRRRALLARLAEAREHAAEVRSQIVASVDEGQRERLQYAAAINTMTQSELCGHMAALEVPGTVAYEGMAYLSLLLGAAAEAQESMLRASAAARELMAADRESVEALVQRVDRAVAGVISPTAALSVLGGDPR